MKKEKNYQGQPKKPRIRIVNKKSGIAIACLLGLFVVALVFLSAGSIIRAFTTNNSDTFQMEDVQLNNAHQSSNLVMHNHAALEVYMQGTKIIVPASIGIAPTLHREHSLDPFGIQDPGMAPMHTHSDDGVIHIESTTMRDYTLGEFLDIWGMNFESQEVALKVNEVNVEGYSDYVLNDGDNLVLEVK
jgi:hypothetical protein